MFRHSLNTIQGFYVTALRYVFILIAFSLKGKPKMRQFIEFL